MTTAREGVQFVESATTPTVKVREGVQFVESATTPTVKVRAGVQFIEVLVGAGGGWFMDALPMDLV